MPERLLLVDDEANVITSIKRALMDEDYEIISANSGADALDIMGENEVRVVVSDERMPGMFGAELLAEIKEKYPNTIRMMLTGYASLEGAMRAVNNGEIYRFFKKPWDDTELKFAIRSAFDKYRLEEENRRLLETVKRQAVDIKFLEKKYPGITRMERDNDGVYVMDDISDDERDEIIRQCSGGF